MANRRQLYRYKGDRCAHCGLGVQEMIARHGKFHRMFQLNHIDPKRKDRDYDNLIRRDLSTKQLDEVDKCVLLCTLCHGIVHAQEITATVKLTMTAGDRKAEQTLTGQMIMDFQDRTATFFTDQKLLILPYWVYIGSKRPKIMFGHELEKDRFIVRQIDRINELRKFAVHTWHDKFQMRVFVDREGEITLEHSVRFPHITSELCGSDGEFAIWVRNGKWLTKEGDVKDDGIFTYQGMRREQES